MATQNGDNVIITLTAESSVVLENTDITELDISDFIG